MAMTWFEMFRLLGLDLLAALLVAVVAGDFVEHVVQHFGARSDQPRH